MPELSPEPPRAPATWLDRIRTATETFKSDDLRGWVFSEGATLVPDADNVVLEITGDARAEWKAEVVLDGRVDFRYRPGGGTGLVLLRSPASRDGTPGYVLRLDNDRLTLQRKGRRGIRTLADSSLALHAAEWYAVVVWLSGGDLMVSVDARPILTVHDDDPWLEPGHVVLAGEQASGIAYRDICVTSVPRGTLHIAPPVPALQSPLDQALQYRGQLAGFAMVPTPGDVPLEVRPYLGPNKPMPINAGNVPPDYTHTWAIDVTGIASFSLRHDGIQLRWDAGDAVLVYDFQLPNPLVTTYESDADLVSKMTTVQQPQADEYRRYYITLRTGPGGPPRRFQVSALHTIGGSGTREALVAGDDLNYDRPGPLIDPSAVAGHRKLFAPWKPECPDVPVGVTIPPPEAREGWYLLARSVSTREAGFFSLLYYNERTSRLRAYLYNVSLSPVATYYQVTFSLATRASGAGFVPLKGALFNADPRPQRWSTASFVIPVWPQNKWAFAETTMLYPMAEKLPAAQHPPASALPVHYYRPLYEEACEKGLTNGKLVVTVQGYLMGQVQGDILGQAIGDAVQKAASSGMSGFELLKGAASAIASGKDYYDKGKSLYQSLKEFLDNKTKEGVPGSELQGLQALVGLGASAFGGFLGVVGLGIGIYQAFFSKPEPMRLALELVIRGTMIGSVFFPLEPSEQTVFLPGRWSIAEAAQAGYPVGSTERVDADAPRYDRTLGHFGFRYDPGRVEFRLLQVDYAWGEVKINYPIADLREYSRYIFPATDHQYLVDPPTPNASTYVSEFLPVIYNPYAEIVPLTPTPVATAESGGIKRVVDRTTGAFVKPGPDPWFEWEQDISPSSHIVPEPDDGAFPRDQKIIGEGSRTEIRVFPDKPHGLFAEDEKWLTWIWLDNGIWLTLPPKPHVVPTTCRRFSELRDLPVHTWWDVRVEGHTWGDGRVFPDSPYPLRDIILYWDVAYYHYPRTRKAPNGDVALYRGHAPLAAPVSIDHREIWFNYADDDGVWFPIIPKQKSMLLLL